MNIITYQASDMDTVQNDSVSFAVQIKRKNEYASSYARQTAVAADMRLFSDFPSTNIPYTKQRTAFNHTIPLMRLNPLPFLAVLVLIPFVH